MSATNGVLGRDLLVALTEADLPRREVVTSRGRAFVRDMGGAGRLAFQAENARMRKERGEDDWLRDYHSRLLVRTLCDETGRLLLGPDEQAVVERLPGVDFDALAEAADELNFPRAEVLAGKSEGTPTA